MDTLELLKKMCTDDGVSGRESELHSAICEILGETAQYSTMSNGSLIVSMGSTYSKHHIMIDAHLDRIGLTVTYIDERGFLKAEPVGGIDLRSLPGSAVTVCGKEKILGVICSVPPHLTDKDEALTRDNIWIDTGLSSEKVHEIVSLGDTVTVKSTFRELLGNKVAVSALDNRAGCAALVQCALLLKDKELPCHVSFVFSSQEETNESGAKTAAFLLDPDEAIVVDVGFAKQDGVLAEKSGSFGSVIVSIAPVLSKKVTNLLIDTAKELDIPCNFETDGSTTGTNADGISVTKSGISCGVLSIPEKNMHTQTEMVCISDIENTAKILAAYIMKGGIANV